MSQKLKVTYVDRSTQLAVVFPRVFAVTVTFGVVNVFGLENGLATGDGYEGR